MRNRLGQTVTKNLNDTVTIAGACAVSGKGYKVTVPQSQWNQYRAGKSAMTAFQHPDIARWITTGVSMAGLKEVSLAIPTPEKVENEEIE